MPGPRLGLCNFMTSFRGSSRGCVETREMQSRALKTQSRRLSSLQWQSNKIRCQTVSCVSIVESESISVSQFIYHINSHTIPHTYIQHTPSGKSVPIARVINRKSPFTLATRGHSGRQSCLVLFQVSLSLVYKWESVTYP